MINLLHSLIRFYCTFSPFEFGKGRLQKIGRFFLKGKTICVKTKHDIELELKFPEDAGWEMLFYRNTFETGTTRFLERVLRPDDVVFDIGANIGWYSLIAAKHAPQGTCHAFEPAPFIFEKLRRNCALNEVTQNVDFNQIALGDEEEGSTELFTFEGLYHGHSSTSPLDRTDFTSTRVSVTTVDRYIQSRGITRIDVVKMDTEGAELNVLHGATGLLTGPRPPVWIIEMNEETSAQFGHSPDQLLEFIASRNNYRFYRVVRAWGKILPMERPSHYQNGDNCLCIPAWRTDITFLP